MNYLYKINSSFDGFTPQKIEERLEKDSYLVYNWREYFDDLSRGDIIFTYFTGPGTRKGIYLISKVSEIKKDKRVIGKVLRYDRNEPLIPPEEFEKYEKAILTRLIGSVYVIPPFLDITFEDFRVKVTISEIDVGKRVNCYICHKKKVFNCKNCPILSTKYLINWLEPEVSLKIPNIEGMVAPFWIIPRQSHLIKITIREHPISKAFYSFKAGYKVYCRLFAFGIINAMENHPDFKDLKLDYIIGIPLSPDKIESGEVDRVSELCHIISKEIGVAYLRDALSLDEPISRRFYKLLGKESMFLQDYYTYLKLNSKYSLADKFILVVDDVITDGKTLRAVSKKIKDIYPSCKIYVATGGIMAKRKNMKIDVFKKFRG